MLKAWIVGNQDNKFQTERQLSELQRLGVKVGNYNEASRCYEDCLIPETARFWEPRNRNRFLWGGCETLSTAQVRQLQAT